MVFSHSGHAGRHAKQRSEGRFTSEGGCLALLREQENKAYQRRDKPAPVGLGRPDDYLHTVLRPMGRRAAELCT